MTFLDFINETEETDQNNNQDSGVLGGEAGREVESEMEEQPMSDREAEKVREDSDF